MLLDGSIFFYWCLVCIACWIISVLVISVSVFVKMSSYCKHIFWNCCFCSLLIWTIFLLQYFLHCKFCLRMYGLHRSYWFTFNNNLIIFSVSEQCIIRTEKLSLLIVLLMAHTRKLFSIMLPGKAGRKESSLILIWWTALQEGMYSYIFRSPILFFLVNLI